MNQELIGKRIKELRIKNNLTQQDLANKLNVTYQAVSKWENGKNLPDLVILNELCKIFNIDLDLLINDKRKSKKKYLLIIPIVMLIIILFLIFKNKDNYEFTPITTTCEGFSISGVVAYNKDKTSIYISNINYCGEEDSLNFKEIECTLYEEIDNKIIKINECKSTKNETNLNDYLKDLTINVEHFSKECKNMNENNLYLEINGKNDNEKIISYKIPLKLDDKCN